MHMTPALEIEHLRRLEGTIRLARGLTFDVRSTCDAARMTRTFEASDIIMLPRLDASSAVALGEALITQAKEEELDEVIARSAKHLRQAVAALSEVASGRLENGGDDDRSEAHRRWAAAFKATHDFLVGWTELPEDAGGERARIARRVYAAMFVDGLRFVRLPYATAWAEGAHRLKWLADQELDEALRELGAGPFLDELYAAQKEYGNALGIKKAMPASVTPSIRDALAEVRGRLRKYVVQVAAHGESETAGAKEQAARLLAPLVRWQTIRSRAPLAPEEEVTPPESPAPSNDTPPTPPIATP